MGNWLMRTMRSHPPKSTERNAFRTKMRAASFSAWSTDFQIQNDCIWPVQSGVDEVLGLRTRQV